MTQIKVKCSKCGKQFYMQDYEAVPCPNCGTVAVGPKHKTGGGCYLTTACVEKNGLDDNCFELTMMRKLRDGYVSKNESGLDSINDYYEYAPQIVNFINNDQAEKEIYANLYLKIQEISLFVANGDYESAYVEYVKMVNYLKKRYSIGELSVAN